jgi:spermidine/putrescine transport system substrate-binding protein
VRWLQDRIDRGLPVTFFKQNYVNALANGDVVASMAWSGDIYQENAIGAPEGLQFATPHDGGLLWTDNMVIPAGALHPVDAITLMDFVYQPAIAALITEFVAYVTPVPEARNQILADADAAVEPGAQEKLRTLADSPLVFLPEEEAAALHTYRELKTDQERAAWNDAFGRFIA